ncbi:hypothetical protein AYO44_11285 [Planctomycetaceae bacterium SCGC AG-212-F19]|nr:hypothetical protein AYO44_11285 [Planctomycetaceae bacterium SCGC AG-212-F19]
MSEALVQEPLQATSGERPWLGIVGAVVAFLGLGLAVLSPGIIQALQPPKKELAAVVADAGVKLAAKLKGIKPAPAAPAQPEIPWALVCSSTATCLGMSGAGSGAVGWIRREDRRLATTAVIAGGLAVAWSYIVLAISVALVLFFLLVLLDLGTG